MVGTVPADAQSVGAAALCQGEDLHPLVRVRLGRNLRHHIDIVITLVAECRRAGPPRDGRAGPLVVWRFFGVWLAVSVGFGGFGGGLGGSWVYFVGCEDFVFAGVGLGEVVGSVPVGVVQLGGVGAVRA